MSNHPIIGFLNNITSGLFVLGTIWFKYWLDSKKSNIDIKKIALEAYEMLGKIPGCLIPMNVACENLANFPNFNAYDFQKDAFDISSELLNKLDIMIVGHFEKLKKDFNEIEKLVIKHKVYMFNIVNLSSSSKAKGSSYQVDVNDLNIKNSNFIEDISLSVRIAQNKLDREYINPIKKQITLQRCLIFLKDKIKIFFSIKNH